MCINSQSLAEAQQQPQDPAAAQAALVAAASSLLSAVEQRPVPVGAETASSAWRWARQLEELRDEIAAADAAGPMKIDAVDAGQGDFDAEADVDFEDAVEDAEESQAVANVEEAVAGETAANMEPAAPERTASQALKKVEVERVASVAESHRDQVQQLRRTVSVVAAEVEDSGSDSEGLPAAHAKVQQLYKQCRNFGEDLMEGMLTLDSLSGLAAADRSRRKQALGVIEPLLAEIDATKARLQRMDAALTAHLAEEEQEEPEEPEQLQRTTTLYSLPEIPDCVDWRRAYLRLRPQVARHGASYVVTARLPGELLRREDLVVRAEGDELVVSGVRRPGAAELARLRVEAERFVRRLAPAQVATLTPRHLEDLVLKLGEGQYGRFEARLPLPEEVDRNHMTADCPDGGLVRVVLPRRKAPRRSPWDPDPWSSFW